MLKSLKFMLKDLINYTLVAVMRHGVKGQELLGYPCYA